LRIAMTGSAAGPDLMLFMQIIGKEACIGRLAESLKKYRSLT
jgi:hypothetical protein